MKKFIISSTTILIAIIATIFFACNKEKETDEQQADASIQNFIKLAHEGAMVHNDGLVYIYEKLTQIKPNNDMLATVESFTLDFIKSNSFFQSNIDESVRISKTVIEMIKNNSKSGQTDLWFSEDENLLSKSQKEWLSRVNETIDTNDDVKEMVENLDKIRDIVIKEGSEHEQYIVIIAIEIAKATMDYWYNNYSAWEKLLSENFSRGWSWKEFGKEDIKGGVSGAVGGALGGAVAGGIGAAPGAAIGWAGGAIAGSAAYAVGALL